MKNGIWCFSPNVPFVLDILWFQDLRKIAQVFHYWFLSLVLWWHSRICLCFICVSQFLNYTLIRRLAAYIRQFGQFVLYINMRMVSNNSIIFLQNFAQFWAIEGEYNLFHCLIDYFIACGHQPAEGSMWSGPNPLFFSCSFVTSRHRDPVASSDFFLPEYVMQFLAFVQLYL